MNRRRRAADLLRDLRGRNALRQQGLDAIPSDRVGQHIAPKCKFWYTAHISCNPNTRQRTPLEQRPPRPAEKKRCGVLGASSVWQLPPADRRSKGVVLKSGLPPATLNTPSERQSGPYSAKSEWPAAGAASARAGPSGLIFRQRPLPTARHPVHLDRRFIPTSGSSRQPVRFNNRFFWVVGSVRQSVLYDSRFSRPEPTVAPAQPVDMVRPIGLHALLHITLSKTYRTVGSERYVRRIAKVGWVALIEPVQPVEQAILM